MIDHIKLKNYRQYRDEKITFAIPEKNRNFTIIQGENGAGKTNLLNAITWCLYGEETHLGERYRGLPILNTTVIRELKSTETCEVEVEIRMKDEEDNKMIVSRTLGFRKSDDGEIKKVPDPLTADGYSKFEVIRQIKRDMVTVPDPEYIVNRSIPKNINEYFFFDGERLNDYFRETAGKEIQKAVFKISQLDLFEKTIEHLGKRKGDFLKQAGKLSSKTEEIREELNTLRGSLKEYEEDTEKLKKGKEEAERKENEFSEKLRTSGIADVGRLEEERVEIERDLDKLEKDIGEFEKDKFDYMIKIAPSIFAYDPILKTKRLIKGREDVGDIPPDYKKNFLEQLLQKGECICGADISEESEYRENIERLLNECDEITNISEELIEENANIRAIIDDMKDFSNKQTFYSKKIRELEENRRRKSERLNKIKEKIGNTNIEKIKMWENKLEEYKKIKNDLFEDITERKLRIEKTENSIARLDRKLDDELRKDEKSKEIRRILKFCDKSLDAANEIKNEMMDDLRRDIEEKTKNQFFNLIWKKETYKDVKINNEYKISVVHQSGMEGIGTLGAGERQVLALSFIAALNSVSGFDVPIIIDTPLGRISRDPKKNIASNLPNYLRGKQVTMLVTEEEYTQEVRERLSERVGKEYRIIFKEVGKGGKAEVIPYE
jgi:DNA sulfur modification protein DndD